MKAHSSSYQMITKLMFRLLPIQILLAVIGAVNGLISSLFAGNVIGPDSMTATGLYGPVAMLVGSLGGVLVCGSQILCGKYMGENLVQKMQNIFSLDIALSLILGVFFTVLNMTVAAVDATGFLAKDPSVRPLFNRYLIGQAAGIIPSILTAQLSAFLSLENKGSRVTVASIVCVAVNTVLTYLFVIVLRMDVLGLSLASALSMWAFLAVEAQYFFSRKSTLRFTFRRLSWHDTGKIIKIGLPGSIGNGYQTIRGLIVNNLLLDHVGAVGVSAFATSGALMGFFWAIPAGMLSVSRMLYSVSEGEEDRQSLVNTMRTLLYRYVPLMCAVSAVIIALAVPFTRMYYRNPADPVFDMTVWGFRLLPLCLPTGLIGMHFMCFGQVTDRQLPTHILAAMDGFIGVSLFTFLLIRPMGMNSVYVANVLNGILTVLQVWGYATYKNKRIPRTTEDLMVIPKDFGVGEENWFNLSIHSMEEVIRISERIQNFCLEKGIDERRSYLSGLFLEEMAGNVVTYGFASDKKHYTVDIRVVHNIRDDSLILRIRDDCRAFDPAARLEIASPGDPVKNVGVRIVCSMAKDVQYQSVLGLNVLTITL